MDKHELSDAELVEGVAQRSRAALEQLYDRHAAAALGLALRIVTERTIAEEIVQEAFWRVWKRAELFDRQRGNFKSWLYGIVQNLAIDELRRRRGQPIRIEMDDEEETIQNYPDGQVDVAEQAWASVQGAEIQAALTRLPDAQRVVIEKAFFQGLTHREIALELDLPVGTVHTRARTALFKLRDLLSDLRVNER